MSYMTQAIVARANAPVRRTWIAPQPVTYLSAVSDPCALNQFGRWNQERGEASMNPALITIRRPITTAIIKPAIRIMGTLCLTGNCSLHRTRWEHDFQLRGQLPLG